MNPAQASKNELSAFLSNVQTGEARQAPSGWLVPLVAANDTDVPVALLEEGLAEGRTTVEELDNAGTVDRVRVTHLGVHPLLIVDGEEILGAKQNRIFNASFLVPPGSSVELPVSCVEQGRWSYTSANFKAAARTFNATSRSRKLRKVVSSLEATGVYDADQGAVWDEVEDFAARTGVRLSNTAAYDDAIRVRETDVERAMVEHEPVSGQLGVALVVDGKVVAMDVFASPSLYARAWKKCMRGMLGDVYRDSNGAAYAPRDTVRRTLKNVARRKAARTAAPGGGETLHSGGAGTVVSALAWEGTVYHVLVGG